VICLAKAFFYLTVFEYLGNTETLVTGKSNLNSTSFMKPRGNVDQF